MFDNTIHRKTLARQIRGRDFHSTVWSADEDDRDAILTEAVERAGQGFNGVALRHSIRAGKTVYQHASLSEALLTRHISESVRRVTGVRQSDRQAIVKSLIQLTSEGLDFGILKFDIKSFYETVDTRQIVCSLRNDAAFSRQSVQVLESFFNDLDRLGIPGLPRGISLSATLAEYALREFDGIIRNYAGVRFYNRYVDDGIALVSPKVSLTAMREEIQKALPSGIVFNRSKTKLYDFFPYNRNTAGDLEHSFNFLGYKLDVMCPIRLNGSLVRTVDVDIAPSKVKRFKRRISLSLLAYQNDNDFSVLRERLKLLTSNFGYIDSNSGQQRFAGIKYNYGLIDPHTSTALDELDKFYRNVIVSTHPNNRLKPSLTRQQSHNLLGLSFKSGFLNNRFFAFSSDDLKKLTRCWNYA